MSCLFTLAITNALGWESVSHEQVENKNGCSKTSIKRNTVVVIIIKRCALFFHHCGRTRLVSNDRKDNIFLKESHKKIGLESR